MSQQTSKTQPNVRRVTYITLSQIPILIYAVVQLIRFGNQQDYLLLLIGSLLSWLGTMAYVLSRSLNERSGRGCLLTLCGLIPWAFASYVTFYRGLWSLVGALKVFSVTGLLLAVSFMLLGYLTALNLYKLSELTKVNHDVSKQ